MPIAYLVDFDGTLADTSDANYQAYARALLEVEIVISREEFDAQAFGRNWRQFLPALLLSNGKDADPAAIASRKVVHYQETVRHIRFNEALILILKSRSRDIKTALVTSASAANVKAALSSREELIHIFDVVITGDDVTQHKPHPQGFLMAAKQLGVKPEHCVVFEDSDIGMEAARAFGAHALRVCFQCADSPEQELLARSK
jgi:HAD superfamily hydrolase (TIGR01549 family)